MKTLKAGYIKDRIGGIAFCGSLLLLAFFIAYCMLFTLPLTASASQNIEELIKTYLIKNYPWPEIKIRDLSLSSDVSEGAQLNKILVEKGLPGRTVFFLEFEDGKTITATANINAFDWVVLSARPLNRGHFLRKDDMYATTMDITQIPRGAIKSTGEVTGRQLSRSIIANMPIDDNMVADTSMVKVGHRVTILAESPNFTISAAGEIKENGYIGKYVRVINLTSRKTVTGLLVDENTVKVEF